MSNTSNQPPSKAPSLKDYLVHYDLLEMLEAAQQEYKQATSGGPRHLDQKEISARFQHPNPPTKAAHEPA
jgi:hypothetical protein